MLVWSYFEWWYGPGWRDTAQRLVGQVRSIYLNFSVPILLRTLFAPWRRMMTPPGGTLGQRFHAHIDNFVSRWVGLTVRVLAVLAAFILMAATLIVAIVTLIVWPLLPVGGLVLIVYGVMR